MMIWIWVWVVDEKNDMVLCGFLLQNANQSPDWQLKANQTLI